MKIIIVGAGIFGSCIALTLSKNNFDVTLVDSENKIMSKASKNNHNRLHFGFHYPRSLETAKQSLHGYKEFNEKFSKAIIQNFPNYYFIEKNGKVSETEFESFCNELKLEYIKKFPSEIDVNCENLSSSFLTKEPIYDYKTISSLLNEELKNSNVKIIFNKKINKVSDFEGYDIIINATYSNINEITNLFGIDPIKLKLQDVLIPIFEMKKERIGLTIMDGEYCSVLPKGYDNNKFLLYHVKNSVIKNIEGYSIPDEWKNTDEKIIKEEIKKIYNNSINYFPFLKDCKKLTYWRTFRALPINNNDERLSTLECVKLKDKLVITLISGKITTSLLTSEKILKILNEYTIDR